MNKSSLFTIAAILITFIGYSWGIYHLGQTNQRDKDLAAPADTSLPRKLPPIAVPLPPESTKTHRDTVSRTPGKYIPKIAPPLNLTVDVAALQRENDSLRTRIEYLEEPATVTFTDKRGETEEVTYDPKTENFSRILQPIMTVQPQEIDITKNLPAIPSPTENFWVGADFVWAGGVGFLGHIGYKTIGILIGNVADKSAYGITTHFSLGW